MGWSTREVAELAGTTVNTVRHYHRSGLLEQPERMSNGYKQYGARHLLRLLQIRRLRDLGVPLTQIETVGSATGGPAQALHAIDADLATTIERLQRARSEIKAILAGSTTADLPTGFEDLAEKLSPSERSLMLVYAQVYDDAAMADLKKMVDADPDDASIAFEALAADADEAAREKIAQVMGPQLAEHLTNYPWLSDPAAHMPRGARVTQQVFASTVRELYNEAQLDVLTRASILANELVAASRDAEAATNDEGDSDDR